MEGGVSEQESIRPREAEAKPGPYGVGGWLLFFVVVTVLRSLSGFGSTYSDLRDMEDALRSVDIYLRQWADFKLAMLGLAAAVAFMGLLLVYWLYKKKNPATVKAAIAVVWVTGPLAQALSVAITAFYFGSLFLNSIQLAGFVGSITASVIFAGIWTLYFLKSKRVRSTYYGSLVDVNKKEVVGE